MKPFYVFGLFLHVLVKCKINEKNSLTITFPLIQYKRTKILPKPNCIILLTLELTPTTLYNPFSSKPEIKCVYQCKRKAFYSEDVCRVPHVVVDLGVLCLWRCIEELFALLWR